MLSTSTFIGLRYLRSKRRNGFVTFVSSFAIGSTALGVIALLVVLSVMNGLDRELKNRVLRLIPHGFLSSPGGIEEANWQALARDIKEQPGVLGVSPYISGVGLADRRGATKGIEIQGIDPQAERQVSEIGDHMVFGSLEELDSQRYGVVLGNLLAQNLGLTLGDRVELTLPELSITPAGVFPRTKTFKVVGTFEVGATEDQHLAFIHIRDAQKLFRRGDKIDGLRIEFDDLYRAPQAMRELADLFEGNYSIKNWTQTQGSLFEAVKLEKTVTGLMLGIIIAVAAFNIVSSLTMMVAEKRSDIAVLRTMGMRHSDIRNIFIVQGSATGLSGILIGLIVGIPAAIYTPDIVAFFERLSGTAIYDPSVYFVSHLPSFWMWQDTVWVVGTAAFISVVATLYPAKRASKIEPAEALRYDI